MDILPQDNAAYKMCSNSDCENPWLPATTEFFSRNKANKDRLNGRCKACVKKYQNRPGTREHIQAKKAEYRSRPEIKEREQVRQRSYHQLPEVRERDHIYDRERHKKPERQAWRQEYYNRSDVKQHRSDYNKAYHEVYYNQPDNHAHKLVQDKQYYQTHIDRHRELGRIGQHRRRARLRSIPGTYTAEQIQDMLKCQKYKCYYCSAKFQEKDGKYIYHIEHTFPINRVIGTDIPANSIDYLVLACPTCNRSKSDKFPWEWFEGGRLL